MAHFILSIFYLLAWICLSLANEVVLLTGGWPKSKSVEVFDRTGCSISLHLPDRRAGHTGNYFGGKVLICGGFYTKRSCLHLLDGDFQDHSHLEEDRSCHSSVVINEKLALMGGHESPRNMEILMGGKWSRGWPMDHSVDGSCVVALDNRRIMVIGGMGGGDRVSMYDGHKGWTRKRSLPSLPTKRVGHSCILLDNGGVLVAGGWEGAFGKILNTAVVYKDHNSTHISWRELGGRLVTGRGWGQIVRVEGRIRFFGGRDNANKDLDTVEEFDEDANTWTKIGQTMKTPRAYFSAIVVPALRVGCRS